MGHWNHPGLHFRAMRPAGRTWDRKTICHRYFPKSLALIISICCSVFRVTLLVIPEPLEISPVFSSQCLFLFIEEIYLQMRFISFHRCLLNGVFCLHQICVGKSQLFHRQVCLPTCASEGSRKEKIQAVVGLFPEKCGVMNILGNNRLNRSGSYEPG